MGSELNELNDLLKGEHHAANKGAPEAAAAGAGVSGLNQLSDAAAAAEVEVKPPAAQAAQPVAAPVVVTATAARSPRFAGPSKPRILPRTAHRGCPAYAISATLSA
ncbi:hypothetical protein Ndes2526A_g08526 [Nannochloris sp. 'desiccata']